MRIHSHPEYGFLEISLPMCMERVSPSQARRLAGRLLTAANDLDRDMRVLEEEWAEIHGHEVAEDGDDLQATPLSNPITPAPPRGRQA